MESRRYETEREIVELEEDIDVFLNAIPRIRNYRERNNPFLMYDDHEFKLRYRLSRLVVRDIVEMIASHLEPLKSTNFTIDVMNQFLLTLRFYATGNSQQTTADLFNVHQTTACRIIHKVTAELTRLTPTFIKLPETSSKRNKPKEGFYNIGRFPGVIGALDGSHVRIQSPGREIGESFRNRKSYFSINIQAICDTHLRILDVVASWPGSMHDMSIFENSSVRAKLEAGEFPNSYLLGDSAYACRSYILTPLSNPTTPAQERYNAAHIATRNRIERTFGVLKRRFPCLSTGIRIKLDKVVLVIAATCSLHSIAIGLNDEEPPVEPSVILPPGANDEVPNPDLHIDMRNSFSVRNSVIANHFS